MGKIITAAALICAGLFVEARSADCIWAGLTAGSHHFDHGRAKDYEQHNYGPHFETCLGREDLRAFSGWDRNSQRRDSMYLGVSYTALKLGPVGLGVAIGRVSGYGSAELRAERQQDGTVRRWVDVQDEPVWAAFPVLLVEHGRWGMNFLFLPQTERNVGVFAWQLKWKFR